MRRSPAAKRSQELSDRLDAFVDRAAHEMTGLDPARAADLVVASILNGIGGGR
jgi:hypothetical protein